MAKEQVGVQMVAEGVGAFVRSMRKAEGAYDKATGAFGKGSALVASTVGGMTSAVKKVGNVVLGVGKALAAVAVTGVAAFGAAMGAAALALGKLALAAAPLEGIGIAFDKMAGRVGLSLDAMRTAARGTISDFDLMKSANVALTGAGDALGREFGTKLPALLEIARAAAKATGQDVGFMFESLVTGIKRSSPMLIDNTGLQLKLSEANETLAAQLGKTVADLTAEEKQIALLNATLEAGQTMVDDFSGGQLTAAERMAQFRAQVQNTKDQVGLALLPALQALMEPLSDLATNIGPQVIQWAEALGEWLGENIPVAVAKVRTFFEETWPAVQATIANFWETAEPILMKVVDWFTNEGPGALDDLGASFEDVWSFIQEQVEDVVEWFQENLPLIQETGEVLVAFWEDHVVPALDNVWTIIKTIVGTAIDAVLGIIRAVMLVITGDWEGAWEEIKSIAATIWEGIEAVVTEFIEGVLNVVGTNMETFKTDWQGVWDNAKLIVELTWDKIVTMVGTKIDAIIAAVAAKWDDIEGAGENIVAAIKAGISGAWDGFITWLTGKLGSIADLLPWSEPRDPNSPLRGLGKAGEAIVGNIAAGLDTGAAQFASSLAGLMATTGPMMAAAPRLAPATTSTSTTNVNINTGDIVNGMDVAQLRAFILQTVGEAI